MTDTLTAARWLRDSRGFSVIAVDGKIPIETWEAYQTAPADDATLARWFGNGHAYNVGIVTGAVSGVVVIDIDSPDARTWAHDHLPFTPIKTKTAKGEHWFYRHPGTPVSNKARIRTENGTLALDVRGDGGYVVAPGSTHASGVPYEKLGDWKTPIDLLPVFDPAWIAPPKAAKASPVTVPACDPGAVETRARAYLREMGPAIEGQGGDHHTLRAAAMLVRNFALDDGTALALLSEWNQGCVPPWTEAELDTKIRNARRYGSHPIGAALETSTGHSPELVGAQPEDVAIPAAETLPAFFARLRDRVHPPDIVPGLVPGIGITMTHGQPRSLKTWMLLETCRAASLADAAFGLDRFRVSAPVQVWYVTEEDPEIEIRDRLAGLFAGRGATTFPDSFHVSIQRSIVFDDPAWQTATIRYALNHGIRVLAVDPIRASSTAVDQGPREIQPLATFLRKFMRETGAVCLIGHHDTKPQPSTPDNRAKPQRASGGGIFSIADSPIHLERLGLDSRAVVTPSHYKFSTAPDPFVLTLEADDPKRPTWVRIQGDDTTAGTADEMVLHDKILDYLREHPSTSGSRVATGIHARKDPTLAALDDLRVRGSVDYFQRGQARLWFVVATENVS